MGFDPFDHCGEDAIGIGAIVGFEFGCEGDGHVLGCDAKRRGFEVEELLFGYLSDEFGAESDVASAFMDHDQSAGFRNGLADAV